MNQGVLYAILSYTMWGFLPLYWKLFQSMSAWEILAHRVIWSFVFVALLLLIRKQFGQVKESAKSGKNRGIVALASLLISSNWLIYIWAVNSGHIIDASLGYYMNPLLNVVLGVLFLKERLHQVQWVSILLAAAAVVMLTVQSGVFPWISLSLALTFGLYGLMKKKVQMESMVSLAWETILVLPIALVYLLVIQANGSSGIQALPTWKMGTLLLSGVATALPLYFFSQAAKRLSLSTVGVIQYLAPTISLLLGVILFHEIFTKSDLVSFLMIWGALVLYTWGSILTSKKTARLSSSTIPTSGIDALADSPAVATNNS